MSFNFQNSEDEKLATLAIATLSRSGALQSAALRDSTGRTYVAINIKSGNLELDALEAVLTIALSSQISSIESVVVAGLEPSNGVVISSHSPGATIWYVSGSTKKQL